MFLTKIFLLSCLVTKGGTDQKCERVKAYDKVAECKANVVPFEDRQAKLGFFVNAYCVNNKSIAATLNSNNSKIK